MSDTAILDEEVKILLVSIGGNRVTVPASFVVEIMERVDVQRVPESEPWLLGLMESGGRLLPLIDLRLKLGLDPPDERSHILLLRPDEEFEAAMLVDRVLEMVSVSLNQIKRPPKLAGMVGSDRYLMGLCAHAGDLFLLLNPREVIRAEERIDLLKILEEVAASAAADD